MNVNFVWAVMSPIIKVDKSNFLQELRQIVTDNKSKQVFWSIQGMARNNIKKFIIDGEVGSRKYKKKLNVIGRTVQFGINYLLYGKFIFEPTDIKTKEELDTLMTRFSFLHGISQYPSKPDPEPFNRFLRKVRLYTLRDYLKIDRKDLGNYVGKQRPLYDRLGGNKGMGT